MTNTTGISAAGDAGATDRLGLPGWDRLGLPLGYAERFGEVEQCLAGLDAIGRLLASAPDDEALRAPPLVSDVYLRNGLAAAATVLTAFAYREFAAIRDDLADGRAASGVAAG